LLKSVRGEVPHGLDLTLKIDGITCLWLVGRQIAHQLDLVWLGLGKV
jgi:hypothetical protein